MLPVARTSKSRKNMRRAHHALEPVNMHACPQCGQTKLPHRICSKCGMINRRLSIPIRVKAKKRQEQ
jgi:large subunit ribosomal protein L32